MRISRAAIAGVLAALSVTAPLAATAEGDVPAACGTTAPAVAQGEQLVERTLYFRGESTVGDVDSFPQFAGDPERMILSPDAPTGTQPKVDVNGSTTVYPASLPGNPIMSAWGNYVENTTRVACFGFTYWATGAGDDMNVLLWPDADFILGESTPASDAATGEGAGVVKYTSSAALDTPLTIDSRLYAQVEAATPASILYDSTDYPSAITLVTIEPAPVPEPTPAPTP